MNTYQYISLRQNPQLKEQAAAWFHRKWGVPKEAYEECMAAYLNQETEYGWEFLCMVQEEEHSDMIRMYVHR